MHAQQIIQLLLQCYRVVGLDSAAVAIMVSREAGSQVFRCMHPTQHSAARASVVRARMTRALAADVLVDTQPTRVWVNGSSQSQHVIVVRANLLPDQAQ